MNKALMRRAIERVWSQGDFDIIGELITSDFVAHLTSPTAELHGPEGVRQYFAMLHEAFPDITFTIEDQIAEGDRAVTRWTAHATHAGPFQGIPATGQQVRVTGLTINRFANDKVVEGWSSIDGLGLLQQLGVIPASAEPAEPVGMPVA
jgi:steroid delta-isomerase-like uncharacterized protein